MKKWHIAATAILSVAMVAVLSVAGINAYLVKQVERVNPLHVGENETCIEEQYDPPTAIEAGMTYQKEVRIKNEKSIPCYVRVFAEQKNPIADTYLAADWNRTDWTKADGYYYYNDVLETGESTEPLLTTLTASKDLDDFSMIIYSESVQARGYSSAQEAFASFEKGR